MWVKSYPCPTYALLSYVGMMGLPLSLVLIIIARLDYYQHVVWQDLVCLVLDLVGPNLPSMRGPFQQAKATQSQGKIDACYCSACA